MLFERLKNKIKGTKVGAGSTINFLFFRGLLPLLRGLLYNITHLRFKPVMLLGKGVDIHSSKHIKNGNNFYIGNYSYISALSNSGLKVGNNVTIREFCWLQITSSLNNPGEGIIIGDNTYIGPRSNLGAAAILSIGERCQIGAGVSFIAENHEFSAGNKIIDQGVKRKGITVSDDCWIGNNCIILDGVEIGKGAVLGAGSVVTKSIPENAVVVGNPAKIIKMRG